MKLVLSIRIQLALIKLVIDLHVVRTCTVLMVLMDLVNVKQAISVNQELVLLYQLELMELTKIINALLDSTV